MGLSRFSSNELSSAVSALACEQKTTSCFDVTMRFDERTSNIASSEKAAIETTLRLTGIPPRSAMESFGGISADGRGRMRILCSLQRVLFAVGVVLLSFCAAAFIEGHVHSRIAVSRFQRQSNAQRLIATNVHSDAWRPDFSLWDQQRIRDYETSLSQHSDQPEAILRIDKIHLVVPVLNGTDDLTLNRGVGRIIGTAHVGAPGNLGIAGHRDGFFRGLKDLNVGDTLQLETKRGAQVYTIDWIQIVTPDDVRVLKSTGAPSLTLVTCYPFYFIGSAPQRYVVHASLTNDRKRETQTLNAALKQRDSDIKENAQWTHEPE